MAAQNDDWVLWAVGYMDYFVENVKSGFEQIGY
jgi:hypothetical protein